MDIQPTPNATRQQHPARLQGPWLLVARAGWLALVIFTLTTFFASIPGYITQIQIPCTATDCQYEQLTQSQIQTLTGIGLSLSNYANFMIAFTIVTIAVCLTVSALIFWHRSHDRMALLVALMLVTLGTLTSVSTAPPSPNFWLLPNQSLALIGQTLLPLVFFLFPSGQFVPGFARWIFIIFFVVQFPFFILPDVPLIPNTSVSHPGWLITISEFLIVALIQIYRYRRVSNTIQRQQTKWVVFGFAIPIIINVIINLLDLLPSLSERGSLLPLISNFGGFLIALLPALSFGFAMLRYRLWDIDVIINRALVYATLTASLALIYLSLVIAIQTFLGSSILQNNDLAIVISTLAIATLFQPLRHRIQALIDRRFYRRKYDIAKTLDAFSATLRSEVDLSHLSAQIISVVEETMQPTYLSLWLYQPHSTTSHRAPQTSTALKNQPAAPTSDSLPTS